MTITCIDTKEVLHKTLDVLKRRDKDGNLCGTIVNVAKELDMTIAAVSKEIADYCEQSEKLKEIFLRRKWPRNVISGYVFVGSKHTTDAEKRGILIKGQHVFAKLLSGQQSSRNKNYVYYLSNPRRKRKYYLHQIVSQNGSKINYRREPELSVWFIENDRVHLEYKDRQRHYNNKILLPSDEVKIEHVKDEGSELGVVEDRALISVTYDWR